MIDQLSLFAHEHPKAVCCHGTFIMLRCAGCQAESTRLHVQFQQDVAAGRYDADGYTTRDRRKVKS